MAATWDVSIFVVDRDAKRINATGTRTDGEDVRTFGPLRAVFVSDNETLAEFWARLIAQLHQSYLNEVASETADAELIDTAEADMATALNALET